MNTCKIQGLENMQDLVRRAHQVNEPVIVFDGEDECLVAMRPAVFERILLESEVISRESRQTLHL